MKMRPLKNLSFFELETLKVLIGAYKVWKKGEDQLHFVFANAIYTLLDIKQAGKEVVRLPVLLTDEFIEQLNQLAKTAKK